MVCHAHDFWFGTTRIERSMLQYAGIFMDEDRDSEQGYSMWKK